jgi:hypothetical protein
MGQPERYGEGAATQMSRSDDDSQEGGRLEVLAAWDAS